MQQTPLHDWHVAHGARMVEFAGWSMPIFYSSITEEHLAVREQVGLFDISHMARLQVVGPQAAEYLDHLLTANVLALSNGEVRYSLVCREDGGILDDVLVYRFPGQHLVVANASNREKILSWMNSHLGAWEVAVEDRTSEWGMVAIQGPAALQLLSAFTRTDPGALRYYTGTETEVSGVPAIVTRTGYTGEDGFEVILTSRSVLSLWEGLIERGTPLGVRPCGLGCRDTLRLEAGMPLYGHEMDESIDPLTAGLGFGVSWGGANFIGKRALLEHKQRGTKQTRVGLIVDGKRIAREGTSVLQAEIPVGHVTSGTFSPTLQKSVAMALIDREVAIPGATLQVDLRGQRIPAQIVRLPFYSRSRGSTA